MAQSAYYPSKRNKTPWLLGVFCTLVCSFGLQAQINFNNPGLNGTRGTDIVPPQWTKCALTPDVQPDQWCVITQPKEGDSYAGFASGEFLGQRLNCALVQGKNYSMSLWLAYDPDYSSTMVAGNCIPRGDRGAPGNFQLWAGTSNCAKQELLYESGVMTPDHERNWVEHEIRFKPNNTYDYILICSDDEGGANVLVDNISQQIVQEPDSFSVDNSNVVCFGDETASATVFPPNIGGSNYEYLWSTSPPQTTQTATGLGAGTYTCTITDNNGPCTASYDVTVTVTGPPELVVNMVCNDVSAMPANGSVAAQPSGGVPPYSYVWAASNTTDSVRNNLDAGSYEVTVTDAKGCSVTGSCQILNPLCDIEITDVSFENPTCFGANNGRASITVSSSHTPVTYEWDTSPVRTTASIDDLGPGTYTVVATDAENCTVTQSVTLEEPPALTLSLTGDSASCFGVSDAEAVAVVSGGTPDYTYNWPGSSSDTYVGPAGTITCTVTDANGCEVSESIVLGEPTEIELTATTTNASCPEVNDGEIVAAASGGTDPYTYGLSRANQQNNPNFANLASGSYQVFVSDARGCFDSLDVTLESETVTVVAPNDTSICEGQEVFLEATGMSTISWTGNGASYANGDAVSPSETTAYVVLGSEPDGCEDRDTMVVTVNPVFDPTIRPAGPFCDGSEDYQLITADAGGIWSGPGVTALGVFQPSTLASGTYEVKYEFTGPCARADSIEIIISSDFDATINPVSTLCEGDAPLSLSSATPGGLWFGTGMEGQDTDSLSPVFNPRIAGGGTHTITHIIEGECGDTATLDITVTAADIASIDPVPDFCPTGATERLSATPAGGSWSGNGISGAGSFNPTTVPGPGTYTVVYTPAGSCVVSDSATVTVVSQIVLQDTSTALNCFGDSNGELVATATGGQLPYTYEWQHDNSISGATASGLSAGNYPLTVTDNLGCSSTKTLVVSQPEELAFSSPTDVTNAPCSGACEGAVTFFVTGGSVSNGYTFTLNGVTQNESTFTGLCAGDYNATITDDNGCELTEVVTIEEPSGIAVDPMISPDFCDQNIGSIDLTVSGGTPPYSYIWDNGESTEDLNALAGGSYEVTITDASGCVFTENYTVSNTPGPQLAGDFHPVQCFGESNGKAFVTVTGGTPPYNYNWNTGSTTDTARGLAADNYTVTVIDDRGCEEQEALTVTQPAEVSVTPIEDTLICVGQNLVLKMEATGGNGAPYRFQVNGENLETDTLKAEEADEFILVATDIFGCASPEMAFEMDYRDSLRFTFDSIFVCPGDAAQVEVEATGGVPEDYQFSWSNGTTGNPTQYITGRNQANDTLFGTLSDGCSVPYEDTVPIFYYANAVPVINPATGCVPLDVNFRLQNNNYAEVSWDFGDGTTANGGTQRNHTYTKVGDYAVTVGVVTVDGCENRVTVDGVEVYPNPSGSILQNPERLTEAHADANFTFLGSDIAGGRWTLLQGNDTLANTNSYPFFYNFDRDTASYALRAVMVSDKGCETPVNKTLRVYKEIRMFIPNAFTPGNADGRNDGFSIGTTGLLAKGFKVVIYNRWGELLYTSSNIDFSWDGYYRGNIVDPGAYTWVINYEDEFGELQEISGTVLVIQ